MCIAWDRVIGPKSLPRNRNALPEWRASLSRRILIGQKKPLRKCGAISPRYQPHFFFRAAFFLAAFFGAAFFLAAFFGAAFFLAAFFFGAAFFTAAFVAFFLATLRPPN